MSFKPPKFGDVYEWDVPTGTVRWFVIAPCLGREATDFEALLLQSTPQFASDPALYRPATIGIGNHPHRAKQRKISGDLT